MSKEAQEYQTKQDSPSFFNGLVLGAAIGAAGFFLFGTKKGKKLKKTLLEGSTKTYEDLKKTAKELEKKGQKLSKKAAKKKVELEKKAAVAQKKVTVEIKQAEKEFEAAKKHYFTRKGRSLRK